MNMKNETRANATTTVFGSEKMLTPAPTQTIPQHKTTPEIAYQLVKDETYPQTQPRLNLATFVTTYMDEYATRLMNEAIDMNYIDETLAYLGPAIDRNFEVWGHTFADYRPLIPDERNPDSFEDAVEDMKDFIRERGAWMDENIEILLQYCHESKIKKFNH